ncbi:hypothetical protein IGI04_037348 [Brassica rapa subsp. trilocularis]|uniref:Uncharacterized protein n=1 Tax=Brassica rapa subsp. trilocularis TaxID=1813537 RepID=A0ABQ7LH38_BRACM|nr:hypothetical protein IGI04_037348 [Brassica rapa subsp. trilocularis]
MAATKMFLIKWYSSSTNLEVFQIWKTSGTTYLLVEVVWTSRKSSGLLGSRLDFSERFGFSDLDLICSNNVFQDVDDLQLSRHRLVLQLKKKTSRFNYIQTTEISLAYIRLLQAHRITNGSHPPIIVSFYDSMNHKNFRIKILVFFSSLWRESERYVVFSSQEWKKKKGKSILGALRASNWLFMVVVVLMTMAIL